MRFHSLNRLFFKSRSNCSIVTPSTPAAPLLALTLRYASHTIGFGISNGFTCDFDSLTWLLPATRLTTKRTRTTRPFAPPELPGIIATTRRSVPLPRIGTLPLADQLLGVLPSTGRHQHTDRHHHSEGFPRFVPAPRPSSRHLHAGQPPGQ